MVSIIVVIGKNREIGCNNQLLWDLPEDMQRFQKITFGHPVIMGQNTYYSIGNPLPGRTNIVLTQNKSLKIDTCLMAYDLEEALNIAGKEKGGDEIFIIGGASIYKQYLPMADKLYLTVVDDSPKADVFFPEYSEFKNIIFKKKSSYKKLNYTFLELTKQND